MRFVILGDLHFSDYPQPEVVAARDSLFQAFFEQISAYQPDLVFAVGDTVNRGMLSEFTGLRQTVQAAGLNFVAVTGNHDMYALEKAEVAPYFLGAYPAVSTNELYTAFDAGLVRFIILDTARVKLSSIDWSGFVSDEQLKWLTQEIASFNAATTPRYLMVLGHHPIYNTTERSTEPMLNIANSDQVYEVFATLQRPPAIYFCGHNHSNSIGGPDALGWYFVQSAAPLDSRSFRLVTVSEEQVQIETIQFDLSDPALQAAFNLTRTSIPSSFSPKEFETVYGKDTDRTLIIKPLSPAGQLQ
jgi:predicted MPP superfamily phosphohydrolase